MLGVSKEFRLFFRGDNRIWSFPSVFPVAITACGGPEGHSSLAIIAFGACETTVPKSSYRLGRMDKKECRCLNLRRLLSSRILYHPRLGVGGV